MFQSLRATHINDLRAETYGEKERRERRKERNKKEYMPTGSPIGILYDRMLSARRLQLPGGEIVTVGTATPEQFRALLHELISKIVIIKKGIVDTTGTIRIRKVTVYRLLGEGEPLGLSDTHIEQVLAGVAPITLDNLEGKWWAVPHFIRAGGFWVRQSALKEAGIDMNNDLGDLGKVRDAALKMESEGLISAVLMPTPRGLVIAQKREGRK